MSYAVSIGIEGFGGTEYSFSAESAVSRATTNEVHKSLTTKEGTEVSTKCNELPNDRTRLY